MGSIRLSGGDIEWLGSFFPSLSFESPARKIVGELSFRACYDGATGELKIEGLKPDERIRQAKRCLCNAFEIEIRMDSRSVEANGWPKVYEVGGRHGAIAKKYGVATTDLHINLDGSCCLGIRYSRERHFSIQRFLYDLVVPFFYRLAYTECWGIEAARNDLWGEHSHGNTGEFEHLREMLKIAQRDPGRNDPCPCGSGMKYKKCCLDEVQATQFRVKPVLKA